MKRMNAVPTSEPEHRPGLVRHNDIEALEKRLKESNEPKEFFRWFGKSWYWWSTLPFRIPGAVQDFLHCDSPAGTPLKIGLALGSDKKYDPIYRGVIRGHVFASAYSLLTYTMYGVYYDKYIKEGLTQGNYRHLGLLIGTLALTNLTSLALTLKRHQTRSTLDEKVAEQ